MDMSMYSLHREAKKSRNKLVTAMTHLLESTAALQKDIDAADNLVEITKAVVNKQFADASVAINFVSSNPCCEIPLGDMQVNVLPPPMGKEEMERLKTELLFLGVRMYADRYPDLWPSLHKSAKGMEMLAEYIAGNVSLEDAAWVASCDLIYATWQNK